jgi:hypothetical protein
MGYNFDLQLNDDVISGSVETDLDLTHAPFGFVGYRKQCSSTMSEDELNEFWNVIDLVLLQNRKSSNELVRVIRAYNENANFGEI